MPTRATLLLAGILAVVSFSPQSGVAADVKKIVTIEGMTEYHLDNGLKVLLYPDASKPTVTVNLTILVGSRHEGYGEAGMAHLLEHMVFKGTPTFPKIPKELQSRGADFNGTTWVDRTNYYETMPATDENLEFGLKMEADRMINSFIKGEDLASEMTVVRNEFEQGENNPSSVLMQRMQSAAFEWHNYGRSTIGNRADIERVPVDRLKVFYKKYYQPDNAMLVVAGKFDEQKCLDLVQKYFGSIPRPERKLDATYTEEPAQDGERLVTLRRVGELAMVGTLFKIPAGAHPDFVPVDILESILTSRPSGRLYKALIDTKKASRLMGASFAWHDPGVMLFLAEVTKGNDPQVVLETMLDELKLVTEKGVTAEEVDRARQKLLKQRELSASETTGIAVELSDWAAQGDWRLYFLYRDRLEKVSAEEVSRVAKEYLKQNNRTVGLYLPTESPERVSIPQTPDLAKMIGDYKGREAVDSGEEFDTDPLAIEKRLTRTKIEGVKTVLLPKKTRGKSVTVRMTLRYGDAESLAGLARTCELLPTIMRRGTKKLDRQALQDALDKNFADLSVSGGAGDITFAVSTKRENLAAALDILRQVAREPSFPEKEFDVLRQEQISGVERRLKDPQALALNAVRRKVNLYPKDHPKYYPTLEEEIEQLKGVDLDGVKKVYNEFLGSSVGELAVVGDFDPKEVVPIFEKMLADWKSPKPYARIKSKAFDIQGSDESIETPDKANAVFFGASIFPLRDDDSDYPAVVIGNYVLGGGGSLSSRLGDRVRQKEGLSYGVGSFFAADAQDPRASFNLFAISNPVNVPKVKTAMKEEIARLLKDGVTAAELDNAKQGYLQNEAVDRSKDETLAATLNSTSQNDRTMQRYADLETRINSLTAEEVVKAMRKHIDVKKLVIVTAGDFAKAKAGETKDEAKPKGP